jgi:hypothetical protein
MLFMTIFTYEPEKRNEVVKRRTDKGPIAPGKIIGEWSSIAGGRVFRLVEVEDPKALFEGVRVWSDLGRIELIPVITMEEVMKLVSTQK